MLLPCKPVQPFQHRARGHDAPFLAQGDFRLRRRAMIPHIHRARTWDRFEYVLQFMDEAVARGAFGAPTFFVGDDMYFGNDRLPLVRAAVLALRD